MRWWAVTLSVLGAAALLGVILASGAAYWYWHAMQAWH
jgi:hypothetical protein